MPRVMPPLTPQDFVAKWRASTLKGRSAAQEHFIDLCRLLGHPTPAEADPTGASFTFEAGVAKQKGGQGWADVWRGRRPAPPGQGSLRMMSVARSRRVVDGVHRGLDIATGPA